MSNIEPAQEARYVHLKFLNSHRLNANIELDFIGLWGYSCGKRDLNAKKIDTKEIMLTLSGGAQPASDSFGSEDLAHCFTTFLNTAIDVADGGAVPENVESMGFGAAELEELQKELSFAHEHKSKIENAPRLMADLLPLIHLFRLFHGYSAKEILTQPM